MIDEKTEKKRENFCDEGDDGNKLCTQKPQNISFILIIIVPSHFQRDVQRSDIALFQRRKKKEKRIKNSFPQITSQITEMNLIQFINHPPCYPKMI